MAIDPNDLDPEQGDKDHQTPADLLQLHEVIEYNEQLAADQGGAQ